MNKMQSKVIKAEYKPGCWILISPMKAKKQYDYGLKVDYVFSFLYDAGEVAAEWEPRYGPIQTWNKCNKDDENAIEHYFYDWHNTIPLSWSQLSVEREQLPEMFLAGNWDAIFDVLKSWTRNR